jgi:hypothetical protein
MTSRQPPSSLAGAKRYAENSSRQTGRVLDAKLEGGICSRKGCRLLSDLEFGGPDREQQHLAIGTDMNVINLKSGSDFVKLLALRLWQRLDSGS